MRAVAGRFGIVLIGGWCLICACARPEAEPAVPEMGFTVDPAFLGAAVQDTEHAVRFQPPAGWQPLSDADVQQARQVVRPVHETVTVEPERLFYNEGNQSLLSVSAFQVAGEEMPARQIEAYAALLEARWPSGIVDKAVFSKDDLRITQLFARLDGRINFTLLFETPAATLLQFDYIIPQQSYAKELKGLESSIGSIEPLPVP